MVAIMELSYPDGGLTPELSFGSHFFQDIVESDVFYAAVVDSKPEVAFYPEKILNSPNILKSVITADEQIESALHLSKLSGIVYADVVTQKLICYCS
jgi:hypothetical protein